jgi:hypothetical protein
MTTHGNTNVCFIHIGTHKTGTTSLQALLASKQPFLQDSGIYVPAACRTSIEFGSHHNLAWELTGDSRFNSAAGTFSQLISEIDAVRSPKVCISSEDFEYLHQKPEAMRLLREGLNRLGYTAKIIVYLRPQADYAESLYSELCKHGISLSFGEFLVEILERKAVRYRTSWVFAFDYVPLLDSFSAVFGRENLIVSSYPDRAQRRGLINDFLSVIGFHGENHRLDRSLFAMDLNPTASFREVIRLHHHNKAISNGATADEGDASGSSVSVNDGWMDARFAPLSLVDLVRIHLGFVGPNRQIRQSYAVKLTSISRDRFQSLLCSELSIKGGWHKRRKFMFTSEGLDTRKPRL